MVDNDDMRLQARRAAYVHATRVAYVRVIGADPVVGEGERPPSFKVDSAQGITTFSGLTDKARVELDGRLEQIKADCSQQGSQRSPGTSI